MARSIGFLVDQGFDLLDLSGPTEVFFLADAFAPDSYRIVTVSLDGGMIVSATGLPVLTERCDPADLDTLIIVGGQSMVDDPSAAQVDLVRAAGASTRRIASVCIGAFLLAATGLLDGRVATTHWRWAAKLQARYPHIRVDGDRIFTSDGGLWTSAGITAGIDLALAMVEEDLGREIALTVARTLVVYHRRSGGQLQHSSLLDHDPDSDRIRRTLAHARENLAAPLTVDSLAGFANLSVRQFGRAFSAATGTTPAKAIERLRVEAARPRVEDGRETLDEIARSVGFLDANRMRQSFIRVAGQTPQGIRRLARHTSFESRATPA